MNIKELMVGDLLRVNRDGLCIKKDTIVQIRGIDGDNNFEEKGLVGCTNCRPLDKNQFDGGIWLDYLDPIPLTPEILEKNGFMEQGFPGWKIYTKDFLILWRNSYPDVLEIRCSKAAYGSFHRSHISFVHELQHALRLCGIDKEIIV